MTGLRRRDFLRTTAIAGGGLLVAACAPGAVAPPGQPAATQPAAAQPTQAAKPAAAPASLNGALGYWHTFTSQSEMSGLEKVTKAFADKYPNITIKSENVPNADFMAKFTLAVQGGGKPDSTMASNVRLPDMVAMGGLKDLTARVASWDQRQYLPDSRFKDATIDGKIYGVPSFAFVNWMYYLSLIHI